MAQVLKEFTSFTGGKVQVFSWGLRHTSGKTYSGKLAEISENTSQEQSPQKRGRGRPRKNQ